MSHVAVVAGCVILDLDAFERALPAGLALVRNQTTHKWFGVYVGDYDGDDAAFRTRRPETFGTCEHAVVHVQKPGETDADFKIRKANGYEIGLVAREDGQPGWEMVYDNWGGGYGLEALAGGAGLSTIRKNYNSEVVLRELYREGYRVETRVDEQGVTHVDAYAFE